MDDDKLQALAKGLNSFTLDTLKYFHWTVSKLCTIIELALEKEWVEYKLHPQNGKRDIKDAPTPDQEIKILQQLETADLFRFQSATLGADKPTIYGGEHGLTGREAILRANDPRGDLEIKYEWGWLIEYDLQLLRGYLNQIEKALNSKKSDGVALNYSSIPKGWKWFDRKEGTYQFGDIGTFTQTGKIRKRMFVALMDTYKETPQTISTQTVKTRSRTKNVKRVSIEINAINQRLKKEIGLYFKGSREGYYTLEENISQKNN